MPGLTSAFSKFKGILSGDVKYDKENGGWTTSVECWFCGEECKVPWGNKNCWDCPSCDQYNGFTEDGDYNKAIPAQSVEDLNHPVMGSSPTGGGRKSKIVLCDSCEHNQTLKVRQLADFVPYEENQFGSEVDAYQRHLEHVYKLCRPCEKRVSRELRRQDDAIKQGKDVWEEEPPPAPPEPAPEEPPITACTTTISQIHQAPWHIRLLLAASMISAACLSATSTHHLLKISVSDTYAKLPELLPREVAEYLITMHEAAFTMILLGFLFTVSAIYLHGKHWLAGLDVLDCFAWLGLILSRSREFKNQLDDDNYVLLVTIITYITLLLSVMNFVSKLKLHQVVEHVTTPTKKLRSHTSSSSSSYSDELPQRPASYSAPGLEDEEFSGDEDDNWDKYSDQLDSLSLGPSQQPKNQNNSGFNHLFNPSSNPTIPPAFRKREKRPLISPARLKLDNSQRRQTHSQPVVYGLFAPTKAPSVRPKADDELSLHSEGWRTGQETHSDWSSKHSAGLYPADTTVKTPSEQSERVVENKKKTSLWMRCLLGISIGVNLALILYAVGFLTYLQDTVSFLTQPISFTEITEFVFDSLEKVREAIIKVTA